VDGGDRTDPPMSPLFFISYARQNSLQLPMPPGERDRHAVRLFGDLSLHVNELVSPPTGVDPGFIDRSIRGGQWWEPDLLDAARTCQVFIPLISPSYVQSEWCTRELETFAARRVVRVAPAHVSHETAILPVIWVRTEETLLPAKIRAIQQFSPEGLPDPRMAALYRENGIYGLLSMRQDEAYDNVVWKLAQRVAEICKSHRVVPAEVEPAKEQG
jgi:TIR domain